MLVEQAAPVKVSFYCAIQSYHLSQVPLPIYRLMKCGHLSAKKLISGGCGTDLRRHANRSSVGRQAGARTRLVSDC